MGLHDKLVGRGAAEGATLREHLGLPPYLTEPVPSASKRDPLLPKDVQQLGGWSKKNVREINLQTLRSMKKEIEGTLQTPNRFPLGLWRSWCPQQPVEDPP